MDNMNVADIIRNVFDNKPKNAEDAFNSAIQQKMAGAIEARRQEVAQEFYGSSNSDVDVEPDEDD